MLGLCLDEIGQPVLAFGKGPAVKRRESVVILFLM